MADEQDQTEDYSSWDTPPSDPELEDPLQQLYALIERGKAIYERLKCASCHDSFIDRWKLSEAYGLAAIYSSKPLMIHRCDELTSYPPTDWKGVWKMESK